MGVKIHFAHRTFQWSNEARGKAAVHCVIIGWALFDTQRKTIFFYDHITGQPHATAAININPYLVDALNVLLTKRESPIGNVPPMFYGSKPTDGGHLLMSDSEKKELVLSEPNAREFIRPFLGAEEYLHGTKRWCLWLKDIHPDQLRNLPQVHKRVQAVKQFRLTSRKDATVEQAQFPMLFGEIRQPQDDYILVPGHTSERREYIPFGFLSAKVICGNANFCIPHGDLNIFGLISSKMHMAWVNYVCGRIKSDYRYTNQIVYNNFPWPSDSTDKQKATIEQAAQGILDARTAHPDSCLADLYDPIAMPPDLRKAHQTLDKAVDAAYGKKTFASDAERVAYLFELYHKYTSLLPAPETPKRLKKTKINNN